MSKTVTSATALNGWTGDRFCPFLVEQIGTMMEKEAGRYLCKDYLSVSPDTVMSRNPINAINERWRQKSAEWMFKVVDYYDLDRDIVSVGMTYLDRMFTETTIHHCWSQIQCRLVAMASLKLAIKLNEPRTLNMDDMIKLGMGGQMVFSAGALIEMEYEILWKVSWYSFMEMHG